MYIKRCQQFLKGQNSIHAVHSIGLSCLKMDCACDYNNFPFELRKKAMVVKDGKELEEPPDMLPSGWAALLFLYGLR